MSKDNTTDSNPFGKINSEWSYTRDAIIARISNLYIDCPECENIIHDDEQYQCGTCGGGARISVLEWVKKEAKAENEQLRRDKSELLENLVRIIGRVEENGHQNDFTSAYNRAKEAITKHSK